MKLPSVKGLLALTVLGTTLAFPQLASAAPAPQLHDDNPNGNFGDWYTGAVPSNASADKPVILFVQGLHSKYTTWYTDDDGYYDAAYKDGYRTAFVQLKDADGGGGNMWTNGEELAKVIKKVADHYGVSKINIVAHSKGGIDTQAALLHYGASPYVNVVHQLATPNKGSEVADLAYSNWASWLAGLIGMKDDAVYSLQTSYMADFRGKTDKLPQVAATKYYMSAGTGDDGVFSVTWFGHAVLPGSDDGAVSVTSAFGLPYGINSFTDNGSEKLSHFKMAKASKTWNQVKPKLSLATSAALSVDEQSDIGEETTKLQPEASNVIIRGGAVKGKEETSFSLESGLKRVTIDTMTASKNTKVTLISPSGKKYKTKVKSNSTEDKVGIFSESSHHYVEIKSPEKGKWSMMVEGADDAYFMYASIQGGSDVKTDFNKKVFLAGDKAKVSIKVNGSALHKTTDKTAKITKSMKGAKAKLIEEIDLQTNESALTSGFEVPTEPGVYNISLDILGENEKGEVFDRSVNFNFAVTDETGTLK